MQYRCHLCKLRFERDEPADVRCPRCQALVKTPVAAPAPTAPAEGAFTSQTYGCTHCLRTFESSNQALLRCKYCDERVEPEEGRRLLPVVDGLTARVKKELLEGATGPGLVSSLQEKGVPQDRAFAFVDRLVLELPFDRMKRRTSGESVHPATECDACGRRDTLTAYDAEWRIAPEEMQRYRAGWGGFEGDFSDPKVYARRALYYLCKACAKEKPETFAGGYPAKNGFARTSFKPAR